MKHDQLFYLINVLGSDSYHDCHIKGSINVPLDSLEAWAEEVDPHTKIVVYCASYACSASEEAFNLLTGMGFDNVYAYEGGISEWMQQGYSIVGDCRSPYLQKKYSKEARNVKTIDAEEVKKLLEDYGFNQ